MAMTKTELEKRKGLKIAGEMKQAGIAERFGKGAALPATRREQRELDRAAGLVPFAVKLPADLAERLRVAAGERHTGLNELVAELLEKSLQK
jgi:hypothetical protein